MRSDWNEVLTFLSYRLDTIYASLFNHFAVKFNEKLTSFGDAESKKLATNVFLEVLS